MAGRNINDLRYADDTTLMAESEEKLKSLLMKVKEESKNVCLKLNVQKTKIMASSPITSWQIDGETMETVTDFIFGGSQTTADGDCSRETKRHLLPVRKVMINLDSILKSRDNPLPTKVHLGKAMVFPLVMGFPGGSEVKASASNVGDPGSIPGSGRSPGEGNGNPLQYSCLENPMDRRAWQATVHRVTQNRRVAQNQTRLK